MEYDSQPAIQASVTAEMQKNSMALESGMKKTLGQLKRAIRHVSEIILCALDTRVQRLQS